MYPQSMFWIKNRYIPAYPFCYIKVGFEGVYITWTCFPDKHDRHVPMYPMYTPVLLCKSGVYGIYIIHRQSCYSDEHSNPIQP